ncbi:SETMR methyltransferase, partial [Pseudoatta argentina]
MEISRKNFRTITFYDYKCNLTPKSTMHRLHLAFGDKALSNRTVYNWFAEFQRTFLCDEFREGRPSTSVVATNVDTVREMIERDRHMTYREIQASLGIDMKAIHMILHDHLSVRKLYSRWIPHNLTETQKQARVTWSKEMLKKFNREHDIAYSHSNNLIECNAADKISAMGGALTFLPMLGALGSLIDGTAKVVGLYLGPYKRGQGTKKKNARETIKMTSGATLPTSGARRNESDIVNLDDATGPGIHRHQSSCEQMCLRFLQTVDMREFKKLNEVLWTLSISRTLFPSCRRLRE